MIRTPLASATGAVSPTANGGGALLVVGKRPLAEGVVEFTFARPDGSRLPDWAPGAHIDVVLPDGAIRQYSLCGDRWDPLTYRIAVQREPQGRGGSAALHHEVNEGDILGFGGPRNNFRLAPAVSYLFVAGGIGITPILPMIRQAEVLDVPWRLLYLGRSRDRLAYLSELDPHGDRVHFQFADEAGRADLSVWRPEDPLTRVYACGPERLLDEVESWAASGAGLPPRTERFTASAAALSGPSMPFQVHAARSGITETVDPGESIIVALRRGGVDILSSCAQGVCGTCETAVLEGSPDHRDTLLDDRERAEGTCMFPCVSRCLGDRIVLDL